VQILIDLEHLDVLGLSYERAGQELAGLVADVRRRMVSTDFARLAAYGIDPGSCLSDLEHAASRLNDDVFRLGDLAAELRRLLLQAAQDQPGGLGPYAAAIPDGAWYRLRSLSDHRGVAATGGGLPVPAGMAGTGTGPGLPTGADVRSQIVDTAQQWIGIPYLWGGGHGAVVAVRGVNVDCSGLVHEVFGENGFDIGGTAQTMYASGTPVTDLAHALPGDLLFWGTPDNIHHVAIYIGDGQMIEAPHTGAWVHATPVYGGDFAGIRRVLP